MSEQPSAPLCPCGKFLRKKTYSVEHTKGTPDPTTFVHFKGDAPKKVLQITRRRPSLYNRETDESLNVWCGEYGGYGDNFFCGLTCGWQWAVKEKRRQAEEKARPPRKGG